MITATATLTETISVTASLGGSVCLPATYTLVDTDVPPNTLDSGSIASGAAATIVAPAASVTVNASPFGTVPSGGALDVPVVNSAGTGIGSKVGANWQIDPIRLYLNGNPEDLFPVEAELFLNVTRDGVAYAPSYDSGTKTLEVVSAPCSGNWTRPTEWIAIPDLTSVDERFCGVLAVFENGYNQLGWQIVGGGTIDWGDGTSVAINGAVQSHIYDYASIAGAVNVYDDGRNYKQVLVDITRTGAAFTDVRIAATTVIVGQPTTFLDIIFSLPNATVVSVTSNRSAIYLERMRVKSLPASFNSVVVSWVFFGTPRLRVWECPQNQTNTLLTLGTGMSPIDDIGDTTTSATNAFSRFAGSLIKAAGDQSYNSATNVQQMFDQCSFIESIGDFSATSSTAGGVAFIRSCTRLHSIGTINCPLWTSLNLFASGCVRLVSVQFTDCALITVTSSAFFGCYALSDLVMPGLTRGISVVNTQMGNAGMSNFANSLGLAAGAQTIAVTGTPFGALLTALDATAVAIAAVITGKGFTIAN